MKTAPMPLVPVVDIAPHPAVQTRYLGPTNHRGARVVATHLNDRTLRATVAWDHALSIGENHAAAVRALVNLRRCKDAGFVTLDGTWHAASVEGGGYVFVFIYA